MDADGMNRDEDYKGRRWFGGGNTLLISFFTASSVAMEMERLKER